MKLFFNPQLIPFCVLGLSVGGGVLLNARSLARKLGELSQTSSFWNTQLLLFVKTGEEAERRLLIRIVFGGAIFFLLGLFALFAMFFMEYGSPE